ncbi:hypothetical protein [Rhodococcus sp. T7]|uniref:hypothetical protein n=1 Tax=Rhodococcus sp. T7 TaxID=627444 RepID=UPI00135AAB3C|nr:hypothetical protein [Rhodococcus sp. T7]KAF0956853.1 hypothetical protein MLGJGCBP_09933 [Rhodococcus sp. T7]KAF0962035.1 hypothetical protein MLGJGCBP_04817 [Rhodococcus sp. T7]
MNGNRRNIYGYLRLILPPVLAIGTLFVPGWYQWAIDKVMTPLGDHPAVLLGVLGVLVVAWWYTGVGWFESNQQRDGRIEQLETENRALQQALAKPDADDQFLFDKILTELPEDSGRLGWLTSGEFSGRSWRQSDMRKISDFTDAYANQKFRDPVVQAAWTDWWKALDDFWRRSLAERTSEDIPIGGGEDYHCEIRQPRERDDTSPTYEQTAEQLMDLRDAIFAARDRFIDAGSDQRFSRRVLIDAITPI